MSRVLFLAAHHILLRTELPRLRALGFEVFCPRYHPRSSSHQSLRDENNDNAATTLPADVLNALNTYDLYGDLSPRILSLLNEHFATVVVTSDPAWLLPYIAGFRGRLLFRVYGQVVRLSDYLSDHGAMADLVERDDFAVVAHAAEAVVTEHAWLKQRLQVVPYIPSQDALAIAGSWSSRAPHRREIMVSCPNLTNPYFRAHHRYLKRHFSDPLYRFYGVQMGRTFDRQIVGTLPPQTYFQQFGNAAGFLYTYREPTVCFLPPIEMMIAGGPVIFLPGSLLDRSMPADAPGRAADEADADAKCRRLADRDTAYADAVVASQAALVARYQPGYVWPRFDVAFRALLSPTARFPGTPLRAARDNRGAAWVVVVDGDDVEFVDGRYVAGDRLSDVRRRLRAWRRHDDVVVAAPRARWQHLHGFFTADDDAVDESNARGLRFFDVDGAQPGRPARAQRSLARRVVGRAARALRARAGREGQLRRVAAAVDADAACAGVVDDAGARDLWPLLRSSVARLRLSRTPDRAP